MKKPPRTLKQIIDAGGLCTPEEAALALAISVPSVYGWARLGKLPAIRLTRECLRFDPTEIQAFIDARRNGNGPAYP
jgi:excisionase family DNA binding protein